MSQTNPRHFIEFFPKLEAVFASGKIEHITCTAQSGSDRILRLMNRPFDVEKFKLLATRLKAIAPKIRLQTHFIVGFPGETEEDFKDSLRLLRELPVDYVKIYNYTDIPGTKSCLMKDKVPERVKNKRQNAMCRVALKKYLKKALFRNA